MLNSKITAGALFASALFLGMTGAQAGVAARQCQVAAVAGQSYSLVAEAKAKKPKKCKKGKVLECKEVKGKEKCKCVKEKKPS